MFRVVSRVPPWRSRSSKAGASSSFTSGFRREGLDKRRPEPVVGQHLYRLVLELGEAAEPVAREELLVSRKAVDAFFRVDDQDPLELVDAVDGTDVDAREVFDVDAGLGDDVRHGGSVY